MASNKAKGVLDIGFALKVEKSESRKEQKYRSKIAIPNNPENLSGRKIFDI